VSDGGAPPAFVDFGILRHRGQSVHVAKGDRRETVAQALSDKSALPRKLMHTLPDGSRRKSF